VSDPEFKILQGEDEEKLKFNEQRAAEELA
jgi:hypothetical protein